jgi:hypothetical protein
LDYGFGDLFSLPGNTRKNYAAPFKHGPWVPAIFQWIRGLFPKERRRTREATLSTSSVAEVKHMWCYISTLPYKFSVQCFIKKCAESRSPLFCDVMQGRLLVTDVSGQPVGTIFKGQAVFLACLTLEDGAGMFRNVGSYQSVLRKISEKRRSNLYREGSLNSRTVRSSSP